MVVDTSLVLGKSFPETAFDLMVPKKLTLLRNWLYGRTRLATEILAILSKSLRHQNYFYLMIAIPQMRRQLLFKLS